MKRIFIITFAISFAILSTTVVRADLLTGNVALNITGSIGPDGSGISDNGYDTGEISLFQLFNAYFADQLGTSLYTSSNQLFNDRGVDPYSSWTTSGSQVMGAYKVAALNHQMSVYDSAGNNLGGLWAAGNIGADVGIVDQNRILPDGQEISFRLDAYWGSDLVYTWSSNPDENDGRFGINSNDNMVHMLALDITDLYNAKYGTDNYSVFMLAWEDMHLYGSGAPMSADWDYQDFVAIVTNLKPSDHSVPEPATLAAIGLGLAGVGFVASRRRKK